MSSTPISWSGVIKSFGILTPPFSYSSILNKNVLKRNADGTFDLFETVQPGKPFSWFSDKTQLDQVDYPYSSSTHGYADNVDKRGGIEDPKTIATVKAHGNRIRFKGDGYAHIQGSGTGTDYVYVYYRVRESGTTNDLATSPEQQAGRGSGWERYPSIDVTVNVIKGRTYELQMYIRFDTDDGPFIQWYARTNTVYPD
jgi:hypothetical protein